MVAPDLKHDLFIFASHLGSKLCKKNLKYGEKRESGNSVRKNWQLCQSAMIRYCANGYFLLNNMDLNLENDGSKSVRTQKNVSIRH